MTFKPLFVFALAAVALAAPSPSSLKVSIKSAAASARSKDILLSATVTNPTSEDIKFIKYGSVLDTLPTRSFRVTKDGKEVAFAGIKVTPNLSHDDAWITISAGQSMTVDHKIGFDYDFVAAGAGKYTFEPINTFQYATSPSQTAHVQSAPIQIDVTEVGSQARIEQTTPTCDDGNKKNFSEAALSEARELARNAASDIKTHPYSAQFSTYFGNNYRDDVWSLFDRIARDSPDSGVRNMYCVDTQGHCSSGMIAYTLIATDHGQITSSDIYLCDDFWGFPVTHNGVCEGRLSNTRGGVILHELTHAVGGTTDIYGCDNVKGIRDDEKKNNADNYACFGSQIHRDYSC